MGFPTKQVQTLRRSLNHRHLRTREANGRKLSYIEGWYAISEANRIFGFDGWNRETVESRCVLAGENRGSFLAIYIAPRYADRVRSSFGISTACPGAAGPLSRQDRQSGSHLSRAETPPG